MCYVLRQMGYRYLRPRPWPDKQDQAMRARFQKLLSALESDPEIEIWYQDESGVMGDPKPRRILAKRGSKPTMPYTGKHIKDNIVGAVCPENGAFFSLILPVVNTESFQIFLDHMQKEIGSGQVVMIMDNASWHKTKALHWGRIEPLYLPPYSPDFNPIERIWLVMKNRFFSQFIARNHAELTDHLMEALRSFMQNPALCRSICGGAK